MGNGTMRDTDQKEFVKVYDSVSQRYSRWDVWCDMIWLFAISIANTVDATHREKREERYLSIAKKYKPEEFQGFTKLFCMMVETLERNPFQDFLGDMYMQLGLGNAKAGQFFTPYCICKAMAEITISQTADKFRQQEYISINDPACGAGATLIAAAETLYCTQHINYQQHALFVAQDIDYTVGLMCYIQLSLIGAAGYVRIGDSLCNPLVGHVLFGEGSADTWYTPMYFHKTWELRRNIEQMKILMRAIKPPMPEQQKEPEQQEEPLPQAAPAALPEPEHEPEAEPEQPLIIEITDKKQRRKQMPGQLMFDLGV